MRIAIVHYHLQSGGVTRIIHHTVGVLAETDCEVVVLSGSEPVGPWEGEVRVIPALLYEADRVDVTPTELVSQLGEAAVDALGSLPDVWHVHNHSLGKNHILPLALRQMAESGFPILFHIHDFAEDGRPENYRQMRTKMASESGRLLSRLLYPVGEHLHYGVLNQRDYSFIEATGMDQDNLHLLPNPVDLSKEQGSWKEQSGWSGETLWVYPTRAIRRKNIGEFLLWATLAEKGNLFVTTLGPENPVERVRYEQWKHLASELHLPVCFEFSRKSNIDFLELLQRAEGLIGTSVAEGFGLAFLEPWLVGKAFCGRDLPEITGEFRGNGVVLPWVYERLDIPVNWLGKQHLAHCGRLGLEDSMAAYGRQVNSGDLQRLLDAWIIADKVDFGRLNEALQEVVIRRLVHSPDERNAICPQTLPEPRDANAIIACNRNVLQKKYSLRGYGKRIMELYQEVASSRSTTVDELDGEILLDHFLAPERLTLLRVD